MTAEVIDHVTLSLPYRPLVWDDLNQLQAHDGHRYEILEGCLVVSASPMPSHQIIAGELFVKLRAARPAGLIVLDTMDIDFGDSVLQPDVMVARASAAKARTPRVRPEDVLLAVEVESPSSRRMDRIAKPSVYAAAGIPAYWRVCLDDPDAPVVVVSSLAGDIYREVATIRAGETVTLEDPFPVEIRPAELIVQGRGD